MAGFDYDVIIIGSGFGGSVAALRAAEKGDRVGVIESGRRWNDEDMGGGAFAGQAGAPRPGPGDAGAVVHGPLPLVFNPNQKGGA